MFNTIESRGSTYCWDFFVGVCRPVLQILTLFQTKKCDFYHPFQTLPLKIHFEFAYFAFFLTHMELKRQILLFPLLVPSKTISDSRPKWARSVPVFRPKQRKNDTLWSGPYLCGVCKEVPHWTLNSPQQWMGRCLEQGNHYDDFNSDINNELYLHDLTIQVRTVLQ